MHRAVLFQRAYRKRHAALVAFHEPAGGKQPASPFKGYNSRYRHQTDSLEEECVTVGKGLIDDSTYSLHRGIAGPCAPAIYVIDAPEHPLDLAGLLDARSSNVVGVPIRDWGNSLTPWPAAGLYRGEPDFGGNAHKTLSELCEHTIPLVEHRERLRPSSRAICGYSLAGLFSLFALLHSDSFSACACLSGSVWYEGWVDHLRSADFDLTGRFAFLSLGTKEKRAARPILHGVQDNMEDCARILEAHGCTICYQTGPGGHMQFVSERFVAGLRALDEWLCSADADKG